MLGEVDSLKFFNQLMRHEGSVQNAEGLHIPYRCTAGALTIGYGHNLDKNPISEISWRGGITSAQALAILQDDVALFEKELNTRLSWTRELSPPRYAVLVNMAFNLGVKGLLAFKTTLGLIEKGDYSAAAKAMLQSRWAKQVKGRAIELSHQMDTGIWQKGA